MNDNVVIFKDIIKNIQEKTKNMTYDFNKNFSDFKFQLKKDLPKMFRKNKILIEDEYLPMLDKRVFREIYFSKNMPGIFLLEKNYPSVDVYTKNFRVVPVYLNEKYHFQCWEINIRETKYPELLIKPHIIKWINNCYLTLHFNNIHQVYEFINKFNTLVENWANFLDVKIIDYIEIYE